MRHAVAFFVLIATAGAALLSSASQGQPQVSPEEQTLQAAGLASDGDALLEFFRERIQSEADLEKLLPLARQLGDANAQTRAKAAAKLIARGPWAVPALRHVINELDSPLAAKEARRCLAWIEGRQGSDVAIAAIRLLAVRKPAAATDTLLAFVPLADDLAVVDAVRAALGTLAEAAGKTDPALTAALHDPLPLRRALAVEVLAANGKLEMLPEIRKLLEDPKPLVRLRASLALVQQSDEKAVGVLIDLLADLTHDERRQAEQALQQLAGEWSPTPALQGDDELSRKVRREAWAGWWRTMDGPALLAVVEQRNLAKKEESEKLPLAAARLLGVRKPAGAAAALLTLLPLTEDSSMKEEIGKALKCLAMIDGKSDPTMLEALGDALAVRRIAAGEALAGAGGEAHWPAVRKLLTDADHIVRLRAAMALAQAHDKEAVPALIDLVAELPRSQAWEVEDLLQRLAEPRPPARLSTDTPAAKKKLREAWQAWWKDNAAALNMAELDAARGAGLTLVAEVGGNLKAAGKKGGVVINPFGGPATGGRVVAIDRSGQIRWQIENLDYPIDVQMLPGDRVLIAEYNANRITERDLRGKIVWEVGLPCSPVNVQRLANGNTFIALYGTAAQLVNQGLPQLMEVDAAGKTVASFNVGAAQQFLKGGIGGFGGAGGFGGPINLNEMLLQAAFKTSDGQMVCLVGYNACIRMDATGKEIKRFAVPQAKNINLLSSLGNIDVTPKGNVVFIQNDNTVTEYDADGKNIWQAKAAGNRATRLANGNTLVSLQTGGVIELDSGGRTVWQYDPAAGYQAVKARRQ